MIYNDVYFEHVSVRNGNTNIHVLTFHKKKTHNTNDKRFSGETTIKEY